VRSDFNSGNGWILRFAVKRIAAMDLDASIRMAYRADQAAGKTAASPS
jgi:hypothetical protein